MVRILSGSTVAGATSKADIQDNGSIIPTSESANKGTNASMSFAIKTIGDGAVMNSTQSAGVAIGTGGLLSNGTPNNLKWEINLAKIEN